MTRQSDPDNTLPVEYEFDPQWKRPRSGALMLRVFQRIRDLELMPLLSRLQLGEHRRYLSVDEEDPRKPIQVLWDAEVAPTLSWSDRYGVVGSGIVVKRRVPNAIKLVGPTKLYLERFAGMAQVSGVVVSTKDYEQTPTSYYVRAHFSKTRRNWVLITDRAFFASAWGLGILGEIGLQTQEEGTKLWHKISEPTWNTLVEKVFQNCEVM